MARGLELRQFDIREASWSQDRQVLSSIRGIVFVAEQMVSREDEWDGRDEDAWHWLATDPEGKPVATARLLPEGQIGRMAVLEEYRGRGVGTALLDQACEKARQLGFRTVFLHAQTHALDFYRAGGFEPDGETFVEAGIAHQRMTRTLAPLSDEVQRVLATGEVPDVALQGFDVAEVSWLEQGKIIRKVREVVLVRELGLDPDQVEDDLDAGALHWQAQSPDQETIGVIRMSLDGVISHLAVSDAHRHQGIGLALLEMAVGKARRFDFRQVSALAPVALAPLFEAAGFSMSERTAADKNWHEYIRLLEMDDPFDRPRTAASGDDYEGDFVYRLGEDDRIVLLRKEPEFANIVLEMCRQASASIRIWSPVLEHKLFDNNELRDVCSVLARRNKYTRVEILIYDSHRIVKNGHALLELSRKLPSSMGIKVVDPELRQLNQEFVIVDGLGLIYRHDHEVFEGYASFSDQTEASRFTRMFSAAWEGGILDPNLRRLRI